jgi:hypothetical protein
MVKEGEYGAKYHVYMYVNGKMLSVETISGSGGWGTKENGGEDEFKYEIFDIL